MSERVDRGINSGLALRILLALCVVVAGAGLMLWWFTGDSTPTAVLKQETPGQIARAQQRPGDEPQSSTLFYYYPADGMLSTGFIPVKRRPDIQAQARELISALFTDQRSSQSSLLRELRVREFYLDALGTAYLDLALDREKTAQASVGDELLTMYAMVNTLMQNFEEIKQVSFLIEGKEAQTLAGHIDLMRKYTKRMDLVKP